MFFPVMIDIEKMDILIVGGGEIACRKAKKLLENKAKVTIISEDFSSDILVLKKEYNEKVELIRKKIYKDLNLDSYNMVYLATNNHALNDYLSEYCRDRNILVNALDNHKNSTFINTGFVRTKYEDEDIVFAVSCNGKNPRLLKKILNKIKESSFLK